MASTISALLLFLARLQILFSTSSAHGDAGNLPSVSVPFLCNPDQANALLQLKKPFFFDRSTTRLQSWRDGTDCCVWEGVGCDASSGNVTVLDLNNRGLSSHRLHPAIFNLTSLRQLDLSMNDFNRNGYYISYPQDNIPATRFETFTMLTHLNMSNIGLGGKIPFGISKLVNLLSLDLSNYFDFSDSDGPYYSFGYGNYLYESSFATLVANLSNLRELRLDEVDLSGNEDWCTSLAASVPNLEVLSLAFCGLLSGPINKSLSKNLRILDLSGNQNLWGHVPIFSDASSLETLILDGTNFSSAKLASSSNFKLLKELRIDGNLVSVDFLSSLGRLGSLGQLYLGFGSVNELGSIFTWIGDRNNLTTLKLGGCNFSMTTPSSVSSFKNLRRLAMYDCNLPGPVISAISDLMHLQTLEMDSCITYGSIPSSFGNLKSLINIYVTDSGFSGPLPAAIGNLTKLRRLSLAACNLSGTIPSSIANFTRLTSLDLSYNSLQVLTLTKEEAPSNFTVSTVLAGEVPSSIFTIPVLRLLDLSSNKLSGPIREFNQALSKLESVYLRNNTLSGEVPSSIFTIPVLRFLDLSSNKLSGPIREFNQVLSKLEFVSLRNNTLSGEVPSSIFSLPVLRNLDLSCNNLSGPIREFDKVPSQLEFVDFSENELSGPIPKAFFQLTSVISLDLSSNNLIGLVDLVWFWRLRKIKYLYLSNNKLSVIETEGNSLLPSDWSGPEVLQLASCNITQFPRSLMHNKYISYLDLSCNKISGDIPKQLWETWSSHLSYLNLSHNMLTGMQLTSNVLPLTSLESLDLSFNGFQGTIPMPNSSFAYLMDYSNNNFSSVLPNFTFYLRDRGYLSMSNNTINEHIPYSICNSSTLYFLDLSYNNFNGPLPSCLIENGRLGVLNLRENHFQGMLPSNITTRCLLQTIDLHGNKVYGRLPRMLSNCLQLEVLDLGSNLVVDTFPSWLRGLPKLSVIVLRSNQLHGSIGDIVRDTKSKESFPSLQIIDLSSNNFSGNLRPQWFEQLKSMMTNFNSGGQIIAVNISAMPPSSASGYRDSTEIMYKGSDMIFERISTTLTAIDFSNNRLEGTIPESIGRLVALRVLNLSHNAFTGEIPTELGSMTNLESLDLSCNQLSGEIPQDLTNLTFLDVLNLSNNHLVGKVPQSRQLSTFGSSSFEGNSGLCGPPLYELPCGVLPNSPNVTNVHKYSHRVDVVLFLFVGLGFGVGFAAAILAKWGRVGRWFVATARAWPSVTTR
ncbi:hypothetical protein EJB05_09909, partial [Eragrostis curvula]